MQTGRVIKNYNGYYYVDTGETELVECRRRGKLKGKILVGDMLDITLLGDHKGVIEKNAGTAEFYPPSGSSQY